jgi:hypothetical protein
MKHLVYLLVLISIITTEKSYSGLYKWTDQNGVTHFTQTPPTHQSHKNQAQELDYNSSSRFRARKINGYYYCGSSPISLNRSSSIDYLISVKRAGVIAKENLNSNQRTKNSDYEEELKCIINFSKSQLRKKENEINQLKKRYKELLTINNRTSSYEKQHCNKERGTLSGKEAQDWMNCYKKTNLEKNASSYELNKLKSLFSSEL